MKHHIYHHNDMDGHASGGLTGVLLNSEQFIDSNDIIYYCMNYGDVFDDSNINYKEDKVYIVDFSLQPNEMMIDLSNKLNEGNLTWIDHHQTSVSFIKENKDFRFLGIVKSEKKAACELVWEWFCFNPNIPIEIRLLSQYDTWNKDGEFNWEDEVVPFQLYMNSFETKPDIETVSNVWSDVVRNNWQDKFVLEECIFIGKCIQDYMGLKNADRAKQNSYEAIFHGIKTIIMNTDQRGSLQFKSLTGSYDMMMTYYRIKKGHWTISFYSDDPKVDCGALAKKLGDQGPFKSGGGHRGAAGFITSTEHLFSLLDGTINE